MLKINAREQEEINQKYFMDSGAKELPPERVAFQDELRYKELAQEQQYLRINDKFETFFV